MNNYSTEPTRKILDRLQSPDKKLKIIHIAGTNGKGSTAEFFTNILICANKKVGTFTSPMVYSFNDQFKIIGQPIEESKLNEYFSAAKAVAEGIDASDFEIQTAGILFAFYKEGCEYAVIECGMGGLTDATNAIEKKELAIITSISLEHTEYLGATIEEICRHKAGIIKNCPAVINNFQPYDEAKEYFKGIGAYFANRITYVGGSKFWYCDKEYELSFEASLQIYNVYNAATAIEGARILGLPESAIYEGIKITKPEGRVQKIQIGGRTYILDGAHNPAAFKPLQQYLSGFKGEKITIIFGCLSDKDIDGNLSALAGVTQNIIAVECPSPRKTSLEKTRSACEKKFKNTLSAPSVIDALNMAHTETVVVCGSFTLLKEAKEWIDSLTEKRQ